MEQQLLSILGSEMPTALPGMVGTTANQTETAAAGTSRAFADVLADTLENLATSDAATAGLPTLALPPATPVTLSQTLLPTTVTNVTDSLSPGNTAALSLDGNRLPQAGTSFPLTQKLGGPDTSGSSVTPSPTNFNNAMLTLVATEADGADFNAFAATAPRLNSDTALTTAASTAAAWSLPSGVAPNPSQTSVRAQFEAATTALTGNIDMSSAMSSQQQGYQSHQGQDTNNSHNLRSEVNFTTPWSDPLATFNLITPGRSDSALPAPLVLTSTAASMLDVNTGTTETNSMNSSSTIALPTPGAVAAKTDFAIVPTPQQPGWGEAFADRVTFIVKQSLQEAEIRLNPPLLGQIDVRIVFNNDQASMVFSSPHAAVREAIESSLLRLKEMLADSGITLGEANVSDKSLSHGSHGSQERRDAEDDTSGKQERDAVLGNHAAELNLSANLAELFGKSEGSRIDYYA